MLFDNNLKSKLRDLVCPDNLRLKLVDLCQRLYQSRWRHDLWQNHSNATVSSKYGNWAVIIASAIMTAQQQQQQQQPE